LRSSGASSLLYGAFPIVKVKKIVKKIRQQKDIAEITRSSADADNRLDAFSGQSRSTKMVPFHM